MNTPRLQDYELIPGLQDWNDGRGISVEDWIGCVGTFEQAIGYSRLFWPEFVEIEGCIVWAALDVPYVRQWKEHFSGNLREVEGMVNHRHLLDLFCEPTLDPTRAQLRDLGRRLREIWQAKLDHDFPGRHIRVVFGDSEDCDFLDYVITFYQEPPEPLA